MSMTSASSQYFQEHANQWDQLRSSYFTEAVRQSAIAKAYLRPEMTVADVGAGTGFMAAGLAPLVQHVHLLDGSAAMLEVARRNLSAFENLSYHEADGQSLPLPDASLDAVFANMYLHHCPDPLAAIREMVRLLKPGGRLVITDMDSHPYAWLKEEMTDVWQGFEHDQLRAWFREAGLVNNLVDSSGQSCCAQSQDPVRAGTAEQEVHIRVFVATGTRSVSGMRAEVQKHYGALAESGGSCCGPDASGTSSCCAPQDIVLSENIIPLAPASSGSCCGASSAETAASEHASNQAPLVEISGDYSPEEKAQAPQEAAEFSLGCGNPTAFANLRPGEVVLDIGSGGGLDAFLAAGKVGPQGKVIGVDMTPAMLERARQSAQKAGLQQVEFRQGQAEALPVEDGSVDVIISNCVINLTEDKDRVFREAYRALRNGGRLEVSDMVTDRAFPLDLRADTLQWAACVASALPEQEYVDLVAQAGFKNIQVRRSNAQRAGDVLVYSIQVSALK